MVEHFIEMMAGSLRLKEPWFVERAKFDPTRQRVDIYVAVRPDAAFACPECGGGTSRYGYEPQEHLWRHADCMFYPTYVHCRRPRVVCPRCGVRQVSAPFERKNARHTTYFEGYAIMLLSDMPRAAAARALRCDEQTGRHRLVLDEPSQRQAVPVTRLARRQVSVLPIRKSVFH